MKGETKILEKQLLKNDIFGCKVRICKVFHGLLNYFMQCPEIRGRNEKKMVGERNSDRGRAGERERWGGGGEREKDR